MNFLFQVKTDEASKKKKFSLIPYLVSSFLSHDAGKGIRLKWHRKSNTLIFESTFKKLSCEKFQKLKNLLLALLQYIFNWEIF
jgi:hypothetical protein